MNLGLGFPQQHDVRVSVAPQNAEGLSVGRPVE
jgi:hypothetical protein